MNNFKNIETTKSFPSTHEKKEEHYKQNYNFAPENINLNNSGNLSKNHIYDLYNENNIFEENLNLTKNLTEPNSNRRSNIDLLVVELGSGSKAQCCASIDTKCLIF